MAQNENLDIVWALQSEFNNVGCGIVEKTVNSRITDW
jgi:hypothetical protein